MRVYGLLVFIMASGCQWLDERRANLHLAYHGEAIETPTVSPASVEASARVENLGRELLAATPFLGIDPGFQCIGVADAELFHRDSTGVFITEGVVRRCQSDAELSAVLAIELSEMVAEHRLVQVRHLPSPTPLGGMSRKPDGSTDFDPAREIELAQFEKNYRKPITEKLFHTVEPEKIAEELLTNAGIDTKYLKQVQPLIKEARRNSKFAKQFSNSRNRPVWSY